MCDTARNASEGSITSAQGEICDDEDGYTAMNIPNPQLDRVNAALWHQIVYDLTAGRHAAGPTRTYDGPNLRDWRVRLERERTGRRLSGFGGGIRHQVSCEPAEIRALAGSHSRV